MFDIYQNNNPLKEQTFHYTTSVLFKKSGGTYHTNKEVYCILGALLGFLKQPGIIPYLKVNENIGFHLVNEKGNPLELKNSSYKIIIKEVKYYTYNVDQPFTTVTRIQLFVLEKESLPVSPGKPVGIRFKVL